MATWLVHVRSGWESSGIVEVRCLLVTADTEVDARHQCVKAGLIVEHVERVTLADPV